MKAALMTAVRSEKAEALARREGAAVAAVARGVGGAGAFSIAGTERWGEGASASKKGGRCGCSNGQGEP